MFLDTSGLFSYFDTADPRHGETVTFYKRARRRLTHNYVLAELVALLHARKQHRAMGLKFAAALMGNPDIELLWVDPDLHRSAMTLLESQLDKSYSLCDAVSFLLMRATGITESLTTDRHFEQAGFIRLLKP